MKVGKLAVDIDTKDEGSGVQSVDLLYQISEGNGESVVANLCYFMHYSSYVLVSPRENFQFSNYQTNN